MSAKPEDIVRLLYRGVLGREPDDKGLAAHSERLAADLSVEHVVTVLGDFVQSEEFQTRHRSPVVETDVEPVRHLLSVGSRCIPAATLQNAGLRRYSGPFDWLFSSLAMDLLHRG